MGMSRTNIFAGLVTLILGIMVAVEAHRIPDPGLEDVGPGAFPFVLGIVIAACGLLLLLTAFRERRAGEPLEPVRWAAVLAALALLVAYAISLDYLGFFVATALFVVASLMLLGTRGPVRLALSGVAISGGILMIFGVLLRVSLPAGTLFGG